MHNEIDSLIRKLEGREERKPETPPLTGLLRTDLNDEKTQLKLAIKKLQALLVHELALLDQRVPIALLQRLGCSARKSSLYLYYINLNTQYWPDKELAEFLAIGLIQTDYFKQIAEPGQVKYKQRGFLGLSGEPNYLAYGRFLGEPYKLEAIASDPEHFIGSAIWLWNRLGIANFNNLTDKLNRLGLGKLSQRAIINLQEKILQELNK